MIIKKTPLVDDKHVGLVILMYINNNNLATITGPFLSGFTMTTAEAWNKTSYIRV